MKRILTVQDISCLGKCSITIALPVISALGVECVILPTAVLSNHTLFKSFTVKDLADQIVPICEKWQDEGVEFDAIYTGYLGTIEQIDIFQFAFFQVLCHPVDGCFRCLFCRHPAPPNTGIILPSPILSVNQKNIALDNMDNNHK